MNQQKKKMKIYQEEAKTRQTTHWDWDYMRTEEINALMKARERSELNKTQSSTATTKAGLAKILIGLIIILITVGIFFFI